MMRGVDTVEWGSDRNRTPDGYGSAPVRLRSRWVTPVLAGLGLIGLGAAEVLPWVSLKIDAPSNSNIAFGSNVDVSGVGTSVGIDGINTFSALAYHLGLFAMLALVSAVQFSRLPQRRRLVGFAVGLIAGEGLCVLSAVHSFGRLSSLGLTDQQTTARTHTVIEPGTYLSIVGLLLILASVLLSVAPERVRARLADAVREPDDAQFTDEPIELTVTQVKPLDEAHWSRPDPRRR